LYAISYRLVRVSAKVNY